MALPLTKATSRGWPIIPKERTPHRGRVNRSARDQCPLAESERPRRMPRRLRSRHDREGRELRLAAPCRCRRGHRRLSQLRPGEAGNKPAASMLGVLHTTLANPCPAAFAAGLFRVSRLDSGHDGRTLMGRRPMSTYLGPGASFAGRLLLSRSRPARASGKCRKSDLYLCSTNRACPSGELLTCVSTFAPGPVPLPGAFLFRASFCCAPELSFVAAGIMPPPQGFEILPIVTSCLACLGRRCRFTDAVQGASRLERDIRMS
jgi:hypothetical protein